MTLSSMVVSRDWQEVSVLECILSSLHMEVAVEEEPERALARVTKSKIDALIVDCDLDGSTRFLRQLPRIENRSNTVPLVIMGGPHCYQHLKNTGALFAFEKPISVEQAVRTLSAARSLILDGRLRYHRAGLEVPVQLGHRGEPQAEGHMVNVSQGGIQIHTADSIEAAQPLQVSFALPGARSSLKALGEIAWRDQQGHVGIRFVRITPREQRTLELWLARQYFAH